MIFKNNIMIFFFSVFILNTFAMEKEKKFTSRSCRQYSSLSLQKSETTSATELTDKQQWISTIDREIQFLKIKTIHKQGNVTYLTKLRHAELNALKALLGQHDELSLPSTANATLNFQIWLAVNEAEQHIIHDRIQREKDYRSRMRLEERKIELEKIHDVLLHNPNIKSGSIHRYINILKEDISPSLTSKIIAAAIQMASEKYAQSIETSSENANYVQKNKRTRSNSSDQEKTTEPAAKKMRHEEKKSHVKDTTSMLSESSVSSSSSEDHSIDEIANRFMQNPNNATVLRDIDHLPSQKKLKIAKKIIQSNKILNALIKITCAEQEFDTSNALSKKSNNHISVKFNNTSKRANFIMSLHINDISRLLNVAKYKSDELANLVNNITLQLPSGNFILDEQQSNVFFDLPIIIQDAIKSRFRSYDFIYTVLNFDQ